MSETRSVLRAQIALGTLQGRSKPHPPRRSRYQAVFDHFGLVQPFWAPTSGAAGVWGPPVSGARSASTPGRIATSSGGAALQSGGAPLQSGGVTLIERCGGSCAIDVPPFRHEHSAFAPFVFCAHS